MLRAQIRITERGRNIEIIQINRIITTSAAAFSSRWPLAFYFINARDHELMSFSSMQ